ncbi:MAG: hypothetical protein ACKVQQ_08440 [Burkholderiales bacterium]
MTLTVRLPLRVEQELARYCAERKLSKSDAVKIALDDLLAKGTDPSPYDLGVDLFGRPAVAGEQVEDVARHAKRLLRERFRPRQS